MNDKTKTLGIGAAVIGILASLVGAALAGKASKKTGAGETGTGEGAVPAATDAVANAAPATDADLVPPAGAPDPQFSGDGPSGPTAPGQPAPTGEEGHSAPDLASTDPLGPDHRAPVAFRPDMDAPMTAAEREALRPATGPSPSLVSDEGAGVQGPGGDLL